MPGSQSPQVFTADDYQTIVAAMEESARGRWFLAQYAERARAGDTRALLDAVTRLEGVVVDVATPPGTARPGNALGALAALIAEADRELAAIGAAPGGNDAADRGETVRLAEAAFAQVSEAAEAVQEIAWTLREREPASSTCDALDRQARAIYAAAAAQDLAVRRTRRLVRLLGDLEDRLTALVAPAGRTIGAGSDG